MTNCISELDPLLIFRRKVEEDDGAVYHGEMMSWAQDGQETLVRHGQGVMKWADGSCYIGNWRFN